MPRSKELPCLKGLSNEARQKIYESLKMPKLGVGDLTYNARYRHVLSKKKLSMFRSGDLIPVKQKLWNEIKADIIKIRKKDALEFIKESPF